MRRRRLLTLGHSYVASVNRALARELHVAAGERWEVVCAAPRFFHGGEDLGPLELYDEAASSLRVVPLSVVGSSRVHTFCYGPELASVLRQSWDVVHAWEEPYVVAGWQIAMLCRRQARLVFRTAQITSRRLPPPASWFERMSMDRAAAWICPGKTVEAHLASRPSYRAPHLVSPLGVDPALFRPNPERRERVRRTLGWDDEVPVIGFVGRFVPAKGVRLLMDALDRVRTPHRLLLVGAGVLEDELARLGAARGHDFRMLHAEHTKVADYLNAMDVLCAPSQTTSTWREQFGRMLIEAMACGVPVLGSDSGEIPEVVGDAGLILGERDVPAWSHALENLLADVPRRREFRELGLARVHERFTWSRVARNSLRFLESL